VKNYGSQNTQLSLDSIDIGDPRGKNFQFKFEKELKGGEKQHLKNPIVTKKSKLTKFFP
jgi:hypothetical protein